MRQLLQASGNPQRQFPAVHLAGTKGKGSAATMLTRMVQAAGFGRSSRPSNVWTDLRRSESGRGQPGLKS
jgi:UDP-N-acetylmuramate-alanine ligase